MVCVVCEAGVALEANSGGAAKAAEEVRKSPRLRAIGFDKGCMAERSQK
jgi:hypothetical protein